MYLADTIGMLPGNTLIDEVQIFELIINGVFLKLMRDPDRLEI